jgi:predicted transposase/invertase (TIGR01784 family)
MRQIHDRGYKKLFSNRVIFRQLIETFVQQEWVKELDFTDCETLDKTFIADHYKATESDIIYRVKFRGRDAYLVILLEFQSTVDRFMALRVLNYLTNFYMDYVQASQDIRMLPPVFPIVLYNGDRAWTAPVSISDVIDDAALLGRFAPGFEYCPIVERAYLREDLRKIHNIVSTLFLAEQHYDVELLKQEIVEVARHEDERAVSLFVNWFLQLRRQQRITPGDYDELERVVYHDAQEVKTVLEAALEQERQQWQEEGLQKGLQKGIEKGELIGAIQTLQLVLRRPIGDKQVLQERNLDELQQMRQELEAALPDLALLS